MGFGTTFKRLIFGDDPNNARYLLLIYFFTGIVLTLVAGGLLVIAKARGISIFFVIFTVVTAFGIVVVFARMISLFLGAGGSLYTGPSGGGEPDVDFSEVEALVSMGEIDRAIDAYKKSYELHDLDLTPLIRAGELYWIKKGDYRSALECFYEVERKAIDRNTKLDMASRIVELYCAHLSDSPVAIDFCRWVIAQYPGTQAARMAIRFIENEGG